MLACLNIIRQSPDGILKKIFSKLTKPETELARMQAFGAEYLYLTVRTSERRDIDWNKIARLLPPKICLLTPRGLSPPEGFGFRLARFPDFERQVLTRTACALVENSGLPIYRRVLGLLDPDGGSASILAPLLKVYSSVRVVTQNMPVYRDMAKRMMEELGAPVIVGDSPSGFSDCALLVCPGPVPATMLLPPRCPVLAGAGFAAQNVCALFSGLEVLPGPAEGKEIPPGIRGHDFIGAMYEYYNLEPDSFCARQLLINGNPARLEEARRIVTGKWEL